MDEPVRRRGNGTWDHSQGRWELKGKGIRKSPRQLAEYFGEDVPNTKTGSEPFWRRYLAMVREQEQAVKRKQSQHQDRLASLDLIIESLRQEGRDSSVYVQERERVLALPHWDIDTPDIPVAHPDTVNTLNLIGASTDEIAIGMMNNYHAPKKRDIPTIQEEADAHIATLTRKEQWNTRAALRPLLNTCGALTVKQFDVRAYRRYLEALKAVTTWNDTTKARNQGRCHTFLHGIETDYNVPMPFVGDRRYMLDLPQGQKVQYTLEQARLAIREATGINRLSLLLGLNCGFYYLDIVELTPEDIRDNHIIKIRQKLKGRSKVAPSWLLWQETRDVLRFGVRRRELVREYEKFIAKHSLPYHKALRKTGAQLIHDHVGEEESRLYRGENVGGTHGRNYIQPYTPSQIAKLDRALQNLHDLLF